MNFGSTENFLDYRRGFLQLQMKTLTIGSCAWKYLEISWGRLKVERVLFEWRWNLNNIMLGWMFIWVLIMVTSIH